MQKKLFYSILTSCIVLLTTIAFTYAFFSTSIEGEGTDQIVETGTLSLIYKDGQELKLESVVPGKSVSKIISVTNTGTLDANYNIMFKDLINTIVEDELVVSYTCKSYIDYVDIDNKGTESGTCNGITNQVIPLSETISDSDITEGINIIPGITHEYEITVTFIEIKDDQNYNQGKEFHSRINIIDGSNNGYNLSGTLYDANRNPLSEATIEIHSIIKRGKTNYQGDFIIKDVKAGTHELIIKDNEGNELSTSQILISNGEEESANINEIIINSKEIKLNVFLDSNNELSDIQIKKCAPNTYEEKTLVYTMINDNCAYSDGEASPNVTGAKGIDFVKVHSNTNGKGLYYTSNLTKTEDADGDGIGERVYYFRGAVENNYVVFADFCWRIVRTTENGAVKLHYEGPYDDENNTCPQTGTGKGITDSPVYFNPATTSEKYIGYMYGSSSLYGSTNSSMKTLIDTWYENNILPKGQNVTSKIANTIYCGERGNQKFWNNSYRYYGTATRNILYKASGAVDYHASTANYQYKCASKVNDGYTLSVANGGTSGYGNNLLKYPIATVNADELAYAGMLFLTTSTPTFLSSNYAYFTISPLSYSSYNAHGLVFTNLSTKVSYYFTGTKSQAYVKPALSLYEDVIVTKGTGLYNDPYIIG